MRAFVAAAGLWFCANTKATTIVAIWTPTKIVISGDSLVNVNWTGENGLPHHKTVTNCKIRKFGSNYISAAGNYHIQKAGFDIWETAARACWTSTNVAIDVDACAAKLKVELRRTLGRAIGVHDVHLTVLVAGRQNGAPAMDHITLVGTPDGRLSVRSESFRRGRQKWGRVILGERDAIDRYEHGAASTTTISIQEQALSLVRIEAWALPQVVGAPFSTLTIDAAGDHWINPGCCPFACPE